jgi:hypothetical protein
VTGRTCLLDGRHMDPTMAAECPVLRNRYKALGGPSNEGAAIPLQGTPEEGFSSPDNSSTSNTVFRRGRAGKSGRPGVPAAIQRQKARERDRAYRHAD